MMGIKKQVINSKFAKKFKELGFSQDTLWYWWTEEEVLPRWHLSEKEIGKYSYSAYTSSEVGDMLPTRVKLKSNPNHLNWLTIEKMLIDCKPKIKKQKEIERKQKLIREALGQLDIDRDDLVKKYNNLR